MPHSSLSAAGVCLSLNVYVLLYHILWKMAKYLSKKVLRKLLLKSIYLCYSFYSTVRNGYQKHKLDSASGAEMENYVSKITFFFTYLIDRLRSSHRLWETDFPIRLLF